MVLLDAKAPYLEVTHCPWTFVLCRYAIQLRFSGFRQSFILFWIIFLLYLYFYFSGVLYFLVILTSGLYTKVDHPYGEYAWGNIGINYIFYTYLICF